MLDEKRHYLSSKVGLGVQISYLVALSLIFMVVCVSLVTAILVNRSLSADYERYGENVANMLAAHTTIPVLVRSPEGARQAIEIVQTFGNVSQVAVYEKDGALLVQTGDAESNWGTLSDNVRTLKKITLEKETNNYWQYITPVLSDSAEPELEDFEATRQQSMVVGYVRLRVTKDQLNEIRSSIIFANTLVLVVVAGLLLLALRRLTGALTQPLKDFVDTMEMAESKRNFRPRINLSGSTEVIRLSESFNGMMNVLEQREGELAEARDEALTAARLKSEFAANVSHEVRTPLNGIVGTLNLLSDTNLEKEQREYIELAESASEALISMINDIIEFSRLSLDQSTLANQAFDLRSMLEDLLALHARSYRAKELDLLFFYDEQLPDIVESDPNKIRQLLNNLLNNAAKFTEKGSIELSASRHSDEEGKIWIDLSVKDTGIGLNESDLRSIFLPYQQTDGTMSRKYSGTGLGLAICDKLAELMHGDIGVNSSPGEGSEFYVRIPFNRLDCMVVESRHENRVAVLAHSNSERILESIANLCRRENLECHASCTIEQLEKNAEAISRQAPDRAAVLVCYPGHTQDNLDFWSQIENVASRLELRTIRLSRASAQSMADVEKMDCGRTLLPPLRTAILLRAIEELLGAPEAGEVGRLPSPPASRLQGRRILLVEDNEINQKVTETMLSRANCLTSIAENGLQALQILEKQRFDVILMDCQMPEMNGYDTTRAIRSLNNVTAKTPIVAMTANVGLQEQIYCFEVGMNDFIGKPIKIADLYTVLEKWIFPLSEYEEQKNESG